MASVASQLIEEVTAHVQRDSVEDAREICADGTYFLNNPRIKIMEAAPTCFGLQRNHHQEAIASAELKLKKWFRVEIDVVLTLLVPWRHCLVGWTTF